MSKRFDEQAREIDQSPIMRDIAANFYRTLSTHVPLSHSFDILDYGCGTGLIGMHLYAHVKSLVMMDNSKGMLSVLSEKIERDNIPNMAIMNCEITNSRMAPESFDVIYANNVLHHMADVTEFFQITRNLLKPDGYLCIGDLEKEDGSFHDDNSDVKHFGFDEDELDMFLKNSSLERIKTERYYTVEKPLDAGEIQKFPLFFITTRKM